MKINYNIALLSMAAMLFSASHTEAAQPKAKLLPGDQARSLYNKQKKINTTHKNIEDSTKVPEMIRNGQDSILAQSDLAPNDCMKQGEYKFNLHKDEYATIITSVQKNGKQIPYTKELHEKLQAEMAQDLKDIIKENTKE